MIQVLAKSLAASFLCSALVGMAIAADPLPAETRLVGLSTAPTVTEKDFDIDTAQDLVLTFTDFQVPAALASASIVVTQADAIMGNASLAPPATSATIQLPAASGHYTLRVIGAPDPAFSAGTFSVCVAPKANASNCIQSASLAGNISAQSSAADPTVSTLNVDLTVAAAGTYTVSFTDHQFPVALGLAPNLALFHGSTPVSLGVQSGATFNLSPGKYTLLAIAQADQTVKAGAYGITISGPALLFDETMAVGALGAFSEPNNPATQSLSLKVTDYGFPVALASATALVTSGGTKLGTASAHATASFNAPAGPLKIWSLASAGSDAGTYGVDVSSGAGSLFSSAYGVANGASLAFAFVTPALAAGAYQAASSDFEFPAALQSLKLAVAQNGVLLQHSAAAGSVNFTAAAGPVILLAAAQTPASGNGLFGLTVQTAGDSPQLLFDKTQGVSANGLFDSQQITLGSSGNFDVSLGDLKFPAQFQDLALVVSHGGNVLGKIFGGGTFSFAGTPGDFQLTFIATPAAQEQYGLYAVKVVASAPTITLTATPTTVTAGDLTTLNWTTANAQSCTASGGNWSGSKAIDTGSDAVRVDATVTLTLTCTGPGGSSAKSVDVTATAKPAGSSGGGGAIDLKWLILLASLMLGRGWMRRRTALR